MLLEFVARAVARTRACLPAVRCSSSLRVDQEHLQSILEEADLARSQDNSPRWTGLGEQRKFPPGLFMRPHYFSYKSRFMQRRTKTAPRLVAPPRKETLERDVLREFGIDPLWETSNPALLASFLTEMSKIQPRTETRLTTKTQRKLAKAIRRAKMMGTLPLFYNPRNFIHHKKG